MTSVQRWTLTVVCMSTAVLLINVAAPNVALEAIARDLHASFTDLQWVLSGYALVLAVFQLTAGSLADLLRPQAAVRDRRLPVHASRRRCARSRRRPGC